MNPCSSSLETLPFVSEHERIQELEDLGLLDTPATESFDRITRMASQLLGAPISAISLTDHARQWFKSAQGVDHREIPRENAPCAEVTRSSAVLHVPNLLSDARFADSVLARSGVRFYAGAPLTTKGGRTLGAICVLDTKPRTLSTEQLSSLQDFAAIVMSQIELEHEFGRIDPVSGLPNRQQLQDDLEGQARQTPGVGRVLVLIDLADLRFVTEVISVLGSSYLEDLVRSSAKDIKSVLSKETTLYHVGFSPFALLLDDAVTPWHIAIDMISERLRVPTVAAGTPVTITAAYGVSPIHLGKVSTSDAIRTAVSAVHQARQQHTEYALYNVANDATHQRRFTLLKHLQESLSTGEDLSLVYQPKLDLETGRSTSVEALLRWCHPALGDVSPGEFVPLVEQTTLARPMTQWVLTHALAQVRQWREQNIATRISINVSARNLEEPDFADQVAAALANFGLSSADLEIEFTESALIRQEARVIDQLFRLGGMGIDLSIDDFGTGYSSFSYLRRLPACCVKVDRSFVHMMATDTKAQALVKAMITMAHDLGCRVVAEGVETAEILLLLKQYGCDEAQGYLISRPLEEFGYEHFQTNLRVAPWLKPLLNHARSSYVTAKSQLPRKAS